MENSLIKADVRDVKKKKRTVLLCVLIAALIAILVWAFSEGSSFRHFEAKYLKAWQETWPEHDEIRVGLFWEEWDGVLIPFYKYDGADSYIDKSIWTGQEYIRFEEVEEWFPLNIALTLFVCLILFGAPIVFEVMQRKTCRVTELTVTDTHIVGAYCSAASRKKLRVPIEKVDNLTVSETFMDKIRGGKTLGVCMASGVTKFHFIHNCDEVVNTAMERIEEIRAKEKRAHAHTIIQPPTTQSSMEKMKDLMALREAGMISEEEYEAKRSEILRMM